MSGPESRPRGRLRRSDCSGPGISRRRRGAGFSYLDPEGGRVGNKDTLERIRALAIPPAWREVWICADPYGHIQATGEEYAETNESYGVATVLREHVSIEGGEMVFDFPAKSGRRRVQSIRDPEIKDVNAYLREKVGEEFSAKDFRTWPGPFSPRSSWRWRLELIE